MNFYKVVQSVKVQSFRKLSSKLHSSKVHSLKVQFLSRLKNFMSLKKHLSKVILYALSKKSVLSKKHSIKDDASIQALFVKEKSEKLHMKKLLHAK